MSKVRRIYTSGVSELKYRIECSLLEVSCAELSDSGKYVQRVYVLVLISTSQRAYGLRRPFP